MLSMGVGATGEGLPDPSDASLSSIERMNALVERMRVEQASFESLRASFEQRTQSELLVEPEHARGAFYFQAPDKVRWEYHEPTPKVILVNDGLLTLWYQDLDRAETQRVGRHSDRVLKYLGASGSLETLLEYFELRVQWPQSEDDPYRLNLTPLYDRIAKRTDRIDVAVDSSRFIPVRLRYAEPNGDVTEYVFRDVEVNVDIPGERFELDLPPEVEVHERAQP